MSGKAKRGAAVLGSALRVRPFMTPVKRAVASAPIERPPAFSPDPNEPGCSRWFSNSTSLSSLNRRSFFSSNPQDQSTTSSVPQPRPRECSRELSGAEPPSIPTNIHTPHITKTPHLPLPPSLPYSPNSHPFRRHLEILSLSLYSTADDSWSVYLALHSSLRPHIPDELFRSLLAHQVDNGDLQQSRRQAWSRVRALLRLAKKCQMDLSDIGRDNIFKCLRLGMRRSRAEFEIRGSSKVQANEETDKLVRALWRAMEGVISDYRQIPHEVRRHWLGFQHRRLLHIQRHLRRTGSTDYSSGQVVEEGVLDFVRKGGAEDLGHYVGQVFSISRGQSLDGLQHSLRLLTWTMAQGVVIGVSDLVRVMRQLGSRLAKQGEDGMEVIRKDIPVILDEVGVEPVSTTAQQLYKALDSATSRARTRVQKALDLLETDSLNLGGMLARGISVSIHARDTGSSASIEAALDLLEAALRHREGTFDPLISAITIALDKTQRTTMSSQRIDASIIRFVRVLHEAQITPGLPSVQIIPILRLILSVTPSTEAYILSRKIYQHARSASPPFVWSRRNLFLWRKLFKQALNPSKLHLHFASRLYTDLMADGVPIRRTDALMMIRSIGLRASTSRPILLERHIKDYLWTDYGSSAPLIVALVQGLTNAGTKDAHLALALAQRLTGDKPLQPLVIQMIIAQIGKSSRKEDLVKCFHLLRRLGSGPEAIWNYNTVLSYLVSNASSVSEGDDRLNRSQTLSHAIALYKEMIKWDIRPNARTVSTMIRSLLDGGYLDAGYAVFKACVEQKLVLKSSAVGRLMVRLALNGQIAKAEQVERLWRNTASFPDKRVWDRGVVGARVLIDLKKGVDVDLEQVMEKTGWKGTESFLRFLDTLRPPKSGEGSELSTSTLDIEHADQLSAEDSSDSPSLITSVSREGNPDNHESSNPTAMSTPSSSSFWQKGNQRIQDGQHERNARRPRDEVGMGSTTKGLGNGPGNGRGWDMMVSF